MNTQIHPQGPAQPEEPAPAPAVPSDEAMTAAIEAALAIPEPDPAPAPPRPPRLTPEQDRYITALLHRCDIRRANFRARHRGIEFLREDGSLDEWALARAIIAIARAAR